jgi:hypothetical protein
MEEDKMKLAIAVAAISLSIGVAHASDWVAVYALVDKVVMEPNAEHPERIQLWGVFSMAKPNDRQAYEAPQRGYMYFTLPPEGKVVLMPQLVGRYPEERQAFARVEWSDFKTVAGKRQVVGFGSRFKPVKYRIRKADEKPANPDVYEVELGLSKVGSNTDYPPVKALLEYK